MKNDYYNTWLSVKKKSSKHTSYFDIYQEIFDKLQLRNEIKILEIGVSTGGSLEATARYFDKHENFKIVGLDFNPKVLDFEWDDRRIFVRVGNAELIETFKDIKKDYGEFDLIIDDGGHTNLQQLTCLLASNELLKEEGYLIVEDTQCSYLAEFDNPSSNSFIEVCKTIIDSINGRSNLINMQDFKLNLNIKTIAFGAGYVLFNFKRNENNIVHHQVLNGVLSNGLEDYRFKSGGGSVFNYLLKSKMIIELIKKINKYYLVHKSLKALFLFIKRNRNEENKVKNVLAQIFK